MRLFFKNTLPVTLAAALLAAALAGCSDKQAVSPSPSAAPAVQESENVSASPSATPAVKHTKAEMETQLEADRANLLDVTWSPDNAAVVYLRTVSSGAKIFIWKTSQEKEQAVCDAKTVFGGFLWSPDSRYFLIKTGHTSPNVMTSSVIETKTLKKIGEDLTTADAAAPVWSPDSKYLALSTMDEGTGKISLDIYALAAKSSVSIVSAENAKEPYILEYWKDGVIGYTASTSSGERAEQTVAVGE